MKYKVWKQHKNASAPGEVGGLLRFSSRPLVVGSFGSSGLNVNNNNDDTDLI
jgi:hypothetical protein